MMEEKVLAFAKNSHRRQLDVMFGLASQVYQIYAKQPPDTVHRILRSFGTNYIILEDSICLSRNDVRWPACRLPDIVDQCNGHQLDDPTGVDEEDLVPSSDARFCQAIDFDETFAKRFKRVFHNKTFRVYKVLGGPLKKKGAK